MMVSLLVEAGCTLRLPGDTPPSFPAYPHKFHRHIDTRLSSIEDPSILPHFLSGFSSYIHSPQNIPRILIIVTHDGGSFQVLLLVAPIQSQMLNLLLDKLPEHFNADAACVTHSLKDDIARLQELIGSLSEIIGKKCYSQVV